MMPYGGLIWLKKKEGKEGIFRAIIVDGNYIKLTDKGLDLANLVWKEFV